MLLYLESQRISAWRVPFAKLCYFVRIKIFFIRKRGAISFCFQPIWVLEYKMWILNTAYWGLFAGSHSTYLFLKLFLNQHPVVVVQVVLHSYQGNSWIEVGHHDHLAFLNVDLTQLKGSNTRNLSHIFQHLCILIYFGIRTTELLHDKAMDVFRWGIDDNPVQELRYPIPFKPRVWVEARQLWLL